MKKDFKQELTELINKHSLERNQERSKAMKPVEFPGVNVVFAKDQPEYMPLPAMKIPNDPQGLIITKWQLSPKNWRE